MAESVEAMSYSDIDAAWTLGRLIWLPGELSSARRTSRWPTEGYGVADSTRPKVLCVDDDQAVLDLIDVELGNDFDVITATSGA